MSTRVENSLPPGGASNREAAQALERLALACRRAACAPTESARIEALLELALASSGTERAFLVLAHGAELQVPPMIRASRSLRGDGQLRPSRTVLQQALAASGPMVCLDLGRDSRIAKGSSVRALSLRAALYVPLSLPPPLRAALVLDSRWPPRAPAGGWVKMLEGCAGLLSLALAASTALPALEAQEPGVAPDSTRAALGMAGSSPAFRKMLDSVRSIASSSLPVLVQGESGSGKESISRLLHELSPRQPGPFVAINCTALSDSLLDAELFGAMRGAYTGSERDRPGLLRSAHGGTLFLDEVGDMAPAMQAKLLRALQEGRVRPVGGNVEIPVDVRVIAATHHDLARDLTRGAFRADLYHRLAVLEVRVPPLRERLEDLPLIVEWLSARLKRETGHGPPRLTAGAWELLHRHDWPGNVRELHGVLARALLRTTGREIDAAALDLRAQTETPLLEPPRTAASLELRMIEQALRDAHGSVSRAAACIGWSRQKLYRRMQALSVARPGS